MSDDLVVRGRPYYTKALAALQAAHNACFKHPERDVLGMSHGPFSGVNEALEIVATLEDALKKSCAEIEGLQAENKRNAEGFAFHAARAENEREGRLKAESELSTLRARVREVVGPFAEIRQALELISANKPGDELLDERAIFQTWGLKDTPTSKQITLGHLRAARQLMEEVK